MKKIIIADENWISDDMRKNMGSSQTIVLESELPMDVLADRIQAIGKGASQCRELMEMEDLSLSKTEYLMLMYLMERKGSLVSKGELLKEVWGFSGEVRTRVTDDTLKRIRKKLHAAGCKLAIDTIRGIGYTIKELED